MAKRINKCPSWDAHWGCAISPMKNCSCCASADWHMGKKVPKSKNGKARSEVQNNKKKKITEVK